MWIVTRHGFCSVVQKHGDSFLTVRSRVFEDIDYLAKRIKQMQGYYPPISKSDHSDYRYRFEINHHVFAQLISALIEEIDYPNFKATQKPPRERIYTRVWADMMGLSVLDDDSDNHSKDSQMPFPYPF